MCLPWLLVLLTMVAAEQDGGYHPAGTMEASLENPLGNSLEDPLGDAWSDNCETLDPANGTYRTDPCPYRMSLSKTSMMADQSVTFTLTAPRPLVFREFMVQARDDHTGEAVGEFDTYYVDVKIINCFAKKDNSATHVDSSPKTKIVLRWAPDSNDETSVTFFATIAQEVQPAMIYWVKQKIGTVQISKAA